MSPCCTPSAAFGDFKWSPQSRAARCALHGDSTVCDCLNATIPLALTSTPAESEHIAYTSLFALRKEPLFYLPRFPSSLLQIKEIDSHAHAVYVPDSPSDEVAHYPFKWQNIPSSSRDIPHSCFSHMNSIRSTRLCSLKSTVLRVG